MDEALRVNRLSRDSGQVLRASENMLLDARVITKSDLPTKLSRTNLNRRSSAGFHLPKLPVGIAVPKIESPPKHGHPEIPKPPSIVLPRRRRISSLADSSNKELIEKARRVFDAKPKTIYEMTKKETSPMDEFKATPLPPISNDEEL